MVTEATGRLKRAFRAGAFVPRGIVYFARHTWTWPLGVVPILIAFVVVGFVMAGSWFGVILLLEWFREKAAEVLGSGASPSTVNAVAISAVIVAGSALSLVMILAFAEVVKVIGQPFYQRLCDRLEVELGNPPALPPRQGWNRVLRATRDSAILIAIYLGIALPLLALGIIPVVGQTVVPVLEAMLAAWVIAAELTQIPLERRGLTAMARHRFLRMHRSETIGFGLAALLLFVIPGANVFAVPGAVIGGTLFVRFLEGRVD